MDKNSKITAIAAAAIIVGLVGTMIVTGTIMSAVAKSNPIKGSTVVPGHHGCEVGSNGFIHSKGKCFHEDKPHPPENETGD